MLQNMELTTKHAPAAGRKADMNNIRSFRVAAPQAFHGHEPVVYFKREGEARLQL